MHIAQATTGFPVVDAVRTMLTLRHDAAYYTMWAMWWSVLAIALTGAVAIFAIAAGNRDKRRDRTVALFRLVQGDRHRAVTRQLQPFMDIDQNRVFHSDSWHGAAVTYTGTTANTAPLTRPQYGPLVVEVANLYEELYLHIKWKLVDEKVLLDAVWLLVLTFYYYVQPILAKIENDARLDFSNFRRFARKAQEWARKKEPTCDPRLLSVDTSDRKHA